jgi:D-alanyl-D-alanine carboxypeptidase
VSILVLVTVSLSALAGGWLIDRVTDAASVDARAQLAADAAALAAVAESGPYGRNVQEVVAREYARLNGAELLECKCESWATAVQITVGIGEASATARAVINPEAFVPAAVMSGIEGLHPELARAVDQLIRAAHGRVHIQSGRRSTARQAQLWARALQTYGSPEAADNWVAPPGGSLHERGLAVDLGGDVELAARLVEQLDLPMWRPLPNEPWHFELVGSRD